MEIANIDQTGALLSKVAKTKTPDVYMSSRGHLGWVVYVLPPKKRKLTALEYEDGGNLCWPCSTIDELKKAVAARAEMATSDFDWTIL
jgi:hypothetical protein